jgi:NAD(P)-dependent dehydrogenase (short-subunit alcohol dehydrogenase family)
MAKERRSLTGKVVAITGGAQGIGKATAEALIRKGCRVAIGDIDLALAQGTAEELGGGAVALPLDVTDRSSFESFLDETERQLGPVDILVNNAGIMPVTRFVEETEESMRRQVDINVHGVLIGSQLAMRRMEPRRTGHIVNIASSAGKVGVPGIATYSGTKHAVVGLSEAIRHELRDAGVDVSVVMPVLVNTDLTEGLSEKRGVKEVQPEEVASEIVNALELNRFDVFVPRSLQASIVMGNLLPRRAREAVARFMGVDKVMTDRADRSAYEQRAAESKPEDKKAENGNSTAKPKAKAKAATGQRDAA